MVATLITLSGVQYNFDPSIVGAVSDHDPSTGESVTCVYGIAVDYLQVAESVQQFLSRLQLTAKFAQLTGLNGEAVWISGAAAFALRAPVPIDKAGTAALVLLSSMTQAVRESVAETVAALNGAGGNL